MRQVSLLDVAPTISKVLGVELPEQDGKPIEGVMGWRCKNAILLIVDSLGYSLFRWLEPHLQNMQTLAKEGIAIEAKAVANSVWRRFFANASEIRPGPGIDTGQAGT